MIEGTINNGQKRSIFLEKNLKAGELASARANAGAAAGFHKQLLRRAPSLRQGLAWGGGWAPSGGKILEYQIWLGVEW